MLNERDLIVLHYANNQTSPIIRLDHKTLNMTTYETMHIILKLHRYNYITIQFLGSTGCTYITLTQLGKQYKQKSFLPNN